MNIALLVPSRERMEKKAALVNSIINTVSNINNVSLYFGIDDDDPMKKEACDLALAYPFVKIVNVNNDGKFLGLGKLWNLCAGAATEDIMAMIGDDMVFRTSGWDEEIMAEFNEENCPSDKIKMVYCNDARHRGAIAVNFFVHRNYMNINGYLTREEFMVDFIDIWIQQVLSSLGRVKYRNDIIIEHMHWSFRKSKRDSVVANLRGNDYPKISGERWKAMLQDRIDEAKKIGSIIGVEPDLSKINDRIPG